MTGASSGIGYELAKQFASHDFDLIVAAEDARIADVATELQDLGATVERVQVDLATDTDLHDELKLIDLNVRSTVHLAKHVVRDMVERNQGRVLFTSSIASTMPGAFQAVYNASKSFVQSFALALRNELKDTDVTITSLMPGPTDTEFFERADMLDTKVDPADAAREGFEAVMAGDERVVSASFSTKLQGRASRLMPDSAKAAMHRRMAEPGSGKE